MGGDGGEMLGSQGRNPQLLADRVSRMAIMHWACTLDTHILTPRLDHAVDDKVERRGSGPGAPVETMRARSTSLRSLPMLPGHA